MQNDWGGRTASTLIELWLSAVARLALTAGFALLCHFTIGNAAIMGRDIATFHLVNSVFLGWATILFLATLQRRGWVKFGTGMMIVPALHVIASMPIYTAQVVLVLLSDLIFVGLVLEPMSARRSNGS